MSDGDRMVNACTARIVVDADRHVRCVNCGDDLGPLKLDADEQYEQVTPTGSCWACVFGLPAQREEDTEPSDDDVAEWELIDQLADPCPECGVWGACAYDADGRPMIHTTQEGEG